MSLSMNRSAKHCVGTTIIGAAVLAGAWWSFPSTCLLAQEGSVIVAQSVRPREASATSIFQYGLTRDDLEAIRSTVPALRWIVPVRSVRREVRRADQVTDVVLAGTTPDYAKLPALDLERGRFLASDDDEMLRSVAVLGSQVARRLFPLQDALGEKIRIGGNYFVVVGILKPSRDTHRGTQDHADLNVFIPLSTMRSRLGDLEVVRRSGTLTMEQYELSRIEMLAKPSADVAQITATVEQILDYLHAEDSYTVSNSRATVGR